VRLIQEYLNTIARAYPNIPRIAADGVFGPLTEAAVIAFQREFMLTPDGIIGPISWNRIVDEYHKLSGEIATPPPAYPGTPLRVGSRGDDVRRVQEWLIRLRGKYPSIPPLAADGIFGPITQSAVIAFQRAAGLTPDGIVGPITWNALVREVG
jgi:peptidoglycan hydrolase-like protein with peptidoglycan-binding domain